MEGLALNFYFFAIVFLLNISELCKFLFDLRQILLRNRNVQGSGNRFQMYDFFVRFLDQIRQRLVCAFELIIAVKIFLGIFLGRKLCIQRNRNLFIGVVIEGGEALCAFLQSITVCVDELAVYFIFVALFRVLELL